MHSSYKPSIDLLREFLRAFPFDGLPPTIDELETLVDVTFWASLRAEEGRPARPSLSFTPPGTSPKTFRFSESVPLSVDDLVKISPALRHADVHAGVWRHDDDLCQIGRAS